MECINCRCQSGGVWAATNDGHASHTATVTERHVIHEPVVREPT
jgi:hypothetical protein